MGDSSKLLHASHNAEVCDYLCKNVEYADWVVVTAFYAALHFLDYKIFPIKAKSEDGKHNIKISSIDEYKNITRDMRQPHPIRVELVSQHCTQVSASFRWLKSQAHTVRYLNYQLPDNKRFAETAAIHLHLIKDFCDPPSKK